jgi:hypothetical protein
MPNDSPGKKSISTSRSPNQTTRSWREINIWTTRRNGHILPHVGAIKLDVSCPHHLTPLFSNKLMSTRRKAGYVKLNSH